MNLFLRTTRVILRDFKSLSVLSDELGRGGLKGPPRFLYQPKTPSPDRVKLLFEINFLATKMADFCSSSKNLKFVPFSDLKIMLQLRKELTLSLLFSSVMGTSIGTEFRLSSIDLISVFASML